MKQAKGISKYLGIMFRTKYTKPLIFLFNKPTTQPVHSWFCPNFEIFFFDIKDQLIYRKVVRTYTTIRCPKPYSYFIEIPF